MTCVSVIITLLKQPKWNHFLNSFSAIFDLIIGVKHIMKTAEKQQTFSTRGTSAVKATLKLS
jgi:hypothetical protein